MQILSSMKISTLKLYDKEQPMKQWGLFNNFIPKDWKRDTEDLTQLPALASAKQGWSWVWAHKSFPLHLV